MPQEPNNKAEELLKAYAAKRRQDAGEPMEMPPATRNLLQAEIARRSAAAGGEATPWWQPLAEWWPRLIFGASAAVFIAVAVMILVQTQEPAPRRLQLAKSERTRVEALHEERADTREMKSGAKERAAVGGKAVALAVQPPPPAGPVAPAAAPVPAAPLPTLAKAAPAAPAKPAKEQQMLGFQYNFAQAPADRSAGRQQQVLASFQLNQRGNRVVITDADGSTYEGVVQLAAVDQMVREAVRQTPMREATVGRKVQSARPLADAESAVAPLQQQLMFNAVGTNRSLNQRVVINATLTPAEPTQAGQRVAGAYVNAAPTAAAQTAAAPAAVAEAPAPMQSATRIEGTVRVGEGKEVPINAVSVGK